jgi:tetratricopeptide (TPR) repeat protein
MVKREQFRPGRILGRLIALVLVRVAQAALSRGNYPRAERLFGLALRIAERMLGPTDVVVAAVLNDLGLVHRYQGRFDEAERAYRRAHALLSAARGEVSVELAAAILDGQGKREEAEALFRRALRVFERTHGAQHHEVAAILGRLGTLCQARGDMADAERFFRRALAMKERRLGGDHPEVAAALNDLAVLRRAQGRHAEAEPLHRRALAILERRLGASHPSTVACRENCEALASGLQ